MKIITLAILLLNGFFAFAQSKDLLPEKSFPDGMEGPAIDSNGALYAVSFIKRGTIGVVDIINQSVILFVSLPPGSTGNGIRFNKIGDMIIADYTGHNILKIDVNSTDIEVYAHNSNMNQPNDLTISPKTGYIYLSDPNWKDSNGQIWISRTEGKIELLEGNMGTTNGIEISPDGTKLYVNESVQRRIWQYDIDQEGCILNKRILYEFNDFGLDGMRCDSLGNLFVTRHGKGSVVVIEPNGTIIKEYFLKGKLPTNITIDNKNKTAYVTVADRGCFEVINF